MLQLVYLNSSTHWFW